MPSLIQRDQLESTVCRILQHIGVNITENKKRLATDTEKERQDHLKIFQQKILRAHNACQKIIKRDLDATDRDLPAGEKLCINDSLCPCYRVLWNEAKKLRNVKKYSYFTNNGTVTIKLQGKSPYNIINHIDDLMSFSCMRILCFNCIV